MTVLQNTIDLPDGTLLAGWLDVELVGNPFRAPTQTEALGPIKDMSIVGGTWSIDLPPGLYVITQRRQDGLFHSRWTVEVPDSESAVWLADCLVSVPGTPAAVPLLGVGAVSVDEAGHLVLTYTNGVTVDAGEVRGPEGPEGPQGPSIAGSVLSVKQNPDGTWDNRLTSRTDVRVIWLRMVVGSADPGYAVSPAVNGMYDADIVIGA